MARRDITGTRRAGLAGENSHAFGAAEIAALPVMSPEPTPYGVVKRQAVGFQFVIETVEKLLGFDRRAGRGLSFARKLDEFSAKPGENSFTHGKFSNQTAPILSQRTIWINATTVEICEREAI